MNLSRTTIRRYRQGQQFAGTIRTRAVVSLHSHSDRSQEKLDFLPTIARGIPLVAPLFERGVAQYERVHGHRLDFSQAYWRPPLSPAEVIASERHQIERRFDCAALVSLTDHDTIEGPRALRAAGQHQLPVSVEWSVPFAGTVFHLGVHAIRPDRADEIECQLSAYTAGARRDLAELLDGLTEHPETLVVLNHPYWDIGRVGSRRHDATLLAFLRLHRDRIHALELNGYRTWAENRRVLPLAQGFGLPVVGGGDRHGFCPNTIVNVTEACSLAEFARDLRQGRPTDCVVLPEYEEPYAARVLHTAAGVLRELHRDGGPTWARRVFLRVGDEDRSLASLWTNVPLWVHTCIVATRMLGSPPLRRVFALSGSDGLGLLEADCRPDAVVPLPLQEGLHQITPASQRAGELPSAAA